MNDVVPTIAFSAPVPRCTGLPMPEAQAGPEAETLASVIGQYAAMVGADGTVVTLFDPDRDEAFPLFSGGACADQRELIREAVALPHRDRAQSRERDAKIQWRENAHGDETWMILRVTEDDDRSCLRICAFFDHARSEVKRLAEAAALGMRPMVNGFLRLWNLHRRSAGRVAGLTMALDQSDVGVLLLDRDARILFENREATMLLDAANGIKRRNHSLGAIDLSDALRLQVAINHILACNQDTATKDECAAVVAIRREDRHRPLLIAMVPAHPIDRSGEAAAIAYIFDPDQDLRPLMQPACALYGLSPVEARLACMLANGQPLADAAKAMRIREHTARSYLKQIFMKTDTNRQADLVRLLLTSAVRTIHIPRFEMV